MIDYLSSNLEGNKPKGNGVIVDDVCPMGQTISKRELRTRGKSLKNSWKESMPKDSEAFIVALTLPSVGCACRIMNKGIVFNIERYAIHDGPGIRTTVFFKGCPLRCWWCHNPEGQSQRLELIYRDARCIGCGECMTSCAEGAISHLSKKVVIDRKRCTACGACAKKCPTEALSVAGRKMSIVQTMKLLEKDTPFYGESGGGVTFSGGEPLQQPEFLEALTDECSRKDIDTVLDTSGFAPPKVVKRFCGKVALFLYDIKLMNPFKHKKYTGVSNRLILENAQRIAKSESRLAISIPIIPDINDREANIEETGRFLASLKNVEYVSLLPYHKMGMDKYTNLGKTYRLNRTRTPSNHELQTTKERLEEFGMNVRVEER